MCSTPAIQELCGRGEMIRDAVRCPHKSGRKGQARVAEKMKKQNPTLEITRTHLYVATHMKKYGTSKEQIALIQRLLNDDPSSASRDIDHDPISVVMGRDSRGCVQGMGLGVTRTSLSVIALLRHTISDTQATQSSLSSKFEELSVELQSVKDTLTLLTRRVGNSMPTHTDVGASSQVYSKN